MSNLAPLIIFTYNRLDTTKECFEAISKNDLADKTELFVFSDGPKTEKDEPLVRTVRDYLQGFSRDSVFKSVTIYEAEKNKGLANSIIDGVTKIIEQYGKVIVLEDDLYTTPDFLQYMNGALDYYAENEKIWSIAGYGHKLKSLKTYGKDVYLSYRASCWGWATWKDRWESVDWDVSLYGKLQYYLKERYKFMRGGNDCPSMLKAQMKGKIDSWAIRWCFSQSVQNKYTVQPKVSRVVNRGFGNGVHSLKEDEVRFAASTDNRLQDCNFVDLEIDKKIVRDFKHLHDLTLKGRIVGKIRMEMRCWKKRKTKNKQ